MKDKIVTTEKFKENGFNFEFVEKQLLSTNKLLYFKKYPKDKKRKRTLSQFISFFLNYLTKEYDTYEIGNDTIQCYCGSDRSLTDIFLCCKYYYPECTLEEVAVLLWNKRGLTSWYCPDVYRRIYSIRKIQASFISDLEMEDELDFWGIIRNGRLLRDEEGDDWYG